ncbi:OmpH family outer membrane protein [Caulobacter soli]|uniref:OmpH family outer membrane protein n=1 Tax=Caulobacter soli TaxID=2708539 RepID=UPI0013E99F66|nr:OmpH family outer membrane protein [Caulobacter soli]
MIRQSLLVALLCASAAAPALAQAPAAQPLGGNPVPGVCLLSREAIFANAKVGAAASARLQQLTQDAQAEVETDRKALDVDLKAYQAEQAKLTPAQRQAKEQALAPRVQAMQAKAQQRSREIEATREKALAQISTAAQPVIAQAYKAKGCGLLVDRNSVLGGNLANDLTADVVKGLDATMTTISFNREVLPAAPQAATR